MAQFDPALKREWWVMQEIGQQGGKPVYRRLRYNFVSYDDDPGRFVEPISNDNIVVSAGSKAEQVVVVQTDFGRVAGFEFFTSRPFEVHSFDDFSV